MKRLLRLATLGLICSTLLLGCGGGTVYQPLTPTAVYTFGDGFVDDGQTGSLFTINAINTAYPVYSMPAIIAAGYGIALKPQSQGGTAWGKGGATIADTQVQIAAQEAINNFDNNSLVIVSAGMEDLMRETTNALNGTNSTATATANVQNLAHALSAQLSNLLAHGATHVYVLPPYDMTLTPWMYTQQQTYAAAPSVWAGLYATFQSTLVADAEAINNQTQGLYLSPGFRTRMSIYADPTNLANNAGTSISSIALCAAPGNVNASLCNYSTLITADPTQQPLYMFADNRHPVPNILALLAQAALTELHNRWG